MGFIIKLVRGIINFWVSSAALVALYFCDMIAIGIALSVQNKIPAIEKAAKTHGIIEYVLPALAVFFDKPCFCQNQQKVFSSDARKNHTALHRPYVFSCGVCGSSCFSLLFCLELDS